MALRALQVPLAMPSTGLLIFMGTGLDPSAHLLTEAKRRVAINIQNSESLALTNSYAKHVQPAFMEHVQKHDLASERRLNFTQAMDRFLTHDSPQ